MPLTLTKEVLASVVDGEPLKEQGGITFDGVEYDSRNVKGGELFIALPGSLQHGHAFIPEVFSRGASLALVEDSELFARHPARDRILVVRSTQQAFSTLAGWWRDQLGLPVLGVTGSVGKTTVKEICASLLMQFGPGVYSLKSFNNHVGLPYTLCQADSSHQWCVLEMGMNAPGEIRALATIAKPNIAVITEVAAAHMEAFSSVDGIADAKLEILEGSPPPSTLILPTNNTYLERRIKVREDLVSEILYFSDSAKTDASSYLIEAESIALEGWRVRINLNGEDLSFNLPLLGLHNVKNAVCAVLAVKTLVPALSAEQIQGGFARLRAPQMRLQKKELENGSVIIDDSYNASPESMRAALEVLSSCRSINPDARLGCVLGEMLELGTDSSRFHLELGELVATVNPAFLIALGKYAPEITKGCQQRDIPYFEVESAEAAAHTAQKFGFDYLLVKGSRGIGLDRTVEVLVEQYGLRAPGAAADFKFRE